MSITKEEWEITVDLKVNSPFAYIKNDKCFVTEGSSLYGFSNIRFFKPIEEGYNVPSGIKLIGKESTIEFVYSGEKVNDDGELLWWTYEQGRFPADGKKFTIKIFND